MGRHYKEPTRLNYFDIRTSREKERLPVGIDEMSALQRRLSTRRLPLMVVLNITNACNLSCVHCPQSFLQAADDFKVRHMDWQCFEKIVHEISDNNEPVLLRFTGDGEPTMHPRLFDMLDFAKEHSAATINLTTNATKLTRKRCDAILSQGIDVIDISIDALTKPVYEQVRKGGDFDQLLANISYLLSQREALRAGTKVMVSFVKHDTNKEEADSFVNFWKPQVNEVMVRSLHSAVGLVKSEESKRLSNAEKLERYACPHLWKRLTIDFNHDVKFCAHEWSGNKDVILGNISSTSLASIWRGENLQMIRDRHVSGDHQDGFICTACSDWAASRWDWGYELLIDRVVHGEAKLMPEFADDWSAYS